MRTGRTNLKSRTNLRNSSLTNKPASHRTSSQPALKILLILTIVFVFSLKLVSAAWANSSFDRCKNISITNAGSETLSNFPAYINLTHDNDMLPDFKDIRFYSQACNNGGSLLDYEIENYTTSTRAHIWVRIPSLPSSGKTISVYYKNNTAISNGENPNGVWDNNYKAVYHMGESYALDFDGSDDYVDVPNDNSLTPQNITVVLWLKTYENTAVTTWNGIIKGAKGDGYSDGWRLLDYNNYPRVQINFGGSTPQSLWGSSHKFPINEFVHVAFTYDGQTARLYMNGQELDNLTNSSGINWQGTSDMQIGAAQNYFNGTIDDVHIYNRSLSASEINDSYHNKPVSRTGLVGEWLMNEGSGNNVSDTSGQNNNGDMTGHAATWTRTRAKDSTKNSNVGARNGNMTGAVTGRIANADDFDGIDDYIDCGADPSINNTYYEMTLSAWVKPDIIQNDYTGIISSQSSSKAWMVRYGSFGNNRLASRFGNGTSYDDVVSTLATSANQWTHLVITYNGTNYVYYFNGTPETPDTATISFISPSAYTIKIGTDTTLAANRFFNGTLDEVRVSNTTRSADWINQSYQMIANQASFISFGGEESRTGTTSISSCQQLNSTNTIYELTQSVNSSGTCFNIKANNITLDCKGHTINYSQSSVGYAINITGYDSATIRNCNILHANTSNTYSHTIYLSSSNNNTIVNNTVNTTSMYSEFVYLTSSNSNTIENNTYDGEYLGGIMFYGTCNNNKVKNNTLTLKPSNCCASHVVYFFSGAPSNNLVERNKITTEKGSGVYFYSTSGTNNNITNNTITTTTYYNSYGIFLENSEQVILTNNKINTTACPALMITNKYNHSIDQSNLAEGLPIIYNLSLANQVVLQDQDLSSTYGQLICANCTNVTYDNISMGGDGITLMGTNSSIVKNSNFTTSTGPGVWLRQSSKNKITNNTVIVSGSQAQGIVIESGLSNNITNNVINATGSSTDGIMLYRQKDDVNSTLIANNNITTNTAVGIHFRDAHFNNIRDNRIKTISGGGFPLGYGIWYYTGNTHNNVTNTNITTLGSNAHAIYLYHSSTHSNTFRNMIINATGNSADGIHLTGDTISSFYDTIINTGTGNDIDTSAGSITNLTNVSFNKSDVNFGSSATGRINVFWYLDTYVNDTNGNAVSGATVTAWDKNSNQVFSDTTNSSGLIRQAIREYWENKTNSEYYSNYTVNASKNGDVNSTEVNMTTNKYITLTLPASTGWANSSFDRCKNISITNAGSETLTNFPAYINLTHDNDMLPDFKDIRFYSAGCNNGGSLLDYEIENYTTSTRAHIWVRIPSLPSSGTRISVYYKNNTGVMSGENPTGVWDSNYVAVWHMTEVNATDSTSNQNNGTENGSVTFNSSGRVDGANNLNASTNAYIEVPHDDSLNVTTGLTVSAWVNIHNDGDHDPIVVKATELTAGFHFVINSGPTVTLRTANATNYSDIYSSFSGYTDNWHYVVGVFNGTNEMIYIDDNKKNDETPAIDQIDPSGSVLRIGRSTTGFWGGSSRLNGTIDEVRISNVSRSADWINQSYQMVANQASFVSFGNEEARPGTWSNTNLDRCMNITISNAGSTTLTNFPAYINLTHDNDMLPDFKDIRFYSAGCNNGGSLLDYEIENYTTSTRAHIWVRIPSLPSTGTTISIYYKNNTGVTNGENPTRVWDDNYKGVWHMGERYALDFNGSDDYVVTPELNPYTYNMNNSGLTIEAWYKGNHSSGIGTIAVQGYGDHTWGAYGLFIFTGKIRMSAYANGVDYRQAISNTVVNDSKWHHLVGVVDIDDNKVSIYVDGVFETNDTWEDTDEFETGTNYHNFTIGAQEKITPSITNYLDGIVDQVRVYNRTLSASEINDSYHNKPVSRQGLVGEWLMNKGSGNNVTDTSGQNNNGDMTGHAATWTRTRAKDSTKNSNIGAREGNMSAAVTGRIANADDFDGNDDYVDMGNVLDFNGTTPMTISAWVKAPDNDLNNNIITKELSSSPYTGYNLNGDFDSSNKLHFNLIKSVSPSNRIQVESSTNISDNQWHYVVATYDGSQTAAGVDLYIDGVNETTTTNFDTLSESISNNANLNIGARDDGNNVFNGLIDEARISNTARSPSWINMSYLIVNNQSDYVSFGSEQSKDTCTPPASGTWSVDCSDNCSWTTNQVVPGNMSITGSGHLSLSANLTFNSSNQYIFISPGCTFEVKSGGEIR